MLMMTGFNPIQNAAVETIITDFRQSKKESSN